MLARGEMARKRQWYDARMRVIRFLTTGGIGITVNLGMYHLLVAYAGVHYLPGSVAAVTCSTIVGFLLQKFWTFREHTTETAHVQFALYTLVAIVNIALNTLIVYLLVDFLSVHYLLAQAAAGGIVALWSFFIYREIIFKRIEGSAL